MGRLGEYLESRAMTQPDLDNPTAVYQAWLPVCVSVYLSADLCLKVLTAIFKPQNPKREQEGQVPASEPGLSCLLLALSSDKVHPSAPQTRSRAC